ncbi:THAP domain-containing protein 2-like [Leuresthes tenuis]|uniref:THAP domain-containing protein 2-like n=1 Tax=Leuresthes tenuis TaxID=355514 RepID=UPI003B505A3B
MPDFCAAYGCSLERNAETKKLGVTFHKFPKDKRKRQAWAAALRRRGFIPKDRSVVCSCHFKPQDFDRTGQSTRLKEGVTPSVFNFPVRLCKVPGTTRSSGTSQQQAAAEDQRSRSCSPVRELGGFNLSEKSTSDHQYAFDPVKAKQKLIEAQEKVEELQRSIRNARDRERRQKKTVKFLLDDLKKERMRRREREEEEEKKEKRRRRRGGGGEGGREKEGKEEEWRKRGGEGRGEEEEEKRRRGGEGEREKDKERRKSEEEETEKEEEEEKRRREEEGEREEDKERMRKREEEEETEKEEEGR